MSPLFRKSVTVPALVLSVALIAGPERLGAQTDFYNTDAGRPVQIEDAYATERCALEMKLAPVRLERLRGGVYNWAVEPELAYGILPRTHIEIELPLALTDVAGTRSRYGVASLDLSLFHNLNVETRTLPALALRADVLLPVGALGPSRTYASLKGLATRTYRAERFHVNGQYTFGSRDETPAGAAATPGMKGMNMSSADSSTQSMMDFHVRMMEDPVIRSRNDVETVRFGLIIQVRCCVEVFIEVHRHEEKGNGQENDGKKARSLFCPWII